MKTLENKTRLIFEDEDNFTEQTIKFVKSKNGEISIEIDSPWAGSTEGGFGKNLSYSLSLEQIKKFIEWAQK